MSTQPRGMFISVEGGEGAGKSTQIAFIEQALLGRGLRVLRTREPGGTPLAEEIRGLLLAPREEPVAELAELLLVFAARAQHVQAVIRPALARGEWVLCDRFTDATLAYQGAGRGMSAGLIRALRELVLGDFAPDLTLLLDVPVASGMGRVAARGPHDRFEREETGFHERVREAYLRLAHEEPGRVRVVDASTDIAAASAAVAAEIDAFLQRCGA